MSGLGALGYADARALVNDLRRALRSPGRLAIWLVYAAAIVLFFASRGRSGQFGAARSADLVRADYFMSALLATLAYALAGGRGAIGIFRSRAEARFIIGSPLPAPLAIAYLQAREALAAGRRLFFALVYFLVAFGPRSIGPLGMVADAVFVAATVCAAAAIVLPRRLLPRAAGIACTVVGTPLVLLAVLPSIRNIVAVAPVPVPFASRILAAIPAWHPGSALLAPRPVWLLAVLAVAAAAVAVLASAGRDAYPELYALSVARIDQLARRRLRRTAGTSAVTLGREVGRRLPPPPGVLIFCWKSAVEFGRHHRPAAVAGGAVLAVIGGFVLARLTAASDSTPFVVLVGGFTNVLLVVGVGAVNEIGREIRRPLFWLASAPLFERLCALAFARIWPTVAAVELVAAGFALGGGAPGESLVLALGLAALVALVAAVGFAAFALFPSRIDSRGPVAALRLVLSAAALLPPLVLFAAVAMVINPTLGLIMGVVLAVIEAGGLIGIAAWRLDGFVDRLPA